MALGPQITGLSAARLEKDGEEVRAEEAEDQPHQVHRIASVWFT